MRKIAIAIAAMFALTALGAGAAQAGGGGTRLKGACSNASQWEMRIRLRDDNTFRVRWDVDSGVAGETWQMSVSHDGTVIGSGDRVTNLNGEAEFRLRCVPNAAGTDTFDGTASNPVTGETCAGSLTV